MPRIRARMREPRLAAQFAVANCSGMDAALSADHATAATLLDKVDSRYLGEYI